MYSDLAGDPNVADETRMDTSYRIGVEPGEAGNGDPWAGPGNAGAEANKKERAQDLTKSVLQHWRRC